MPRSTKVTALLHTFIITKHLRACTEVDALLKTALSLMESGFARFLVQMLCIYLTLGCNYGRLISSAILNQIGLTSMGLNYDIIKAKHKLISQCSSNHFVSRKKFASNFIKHNCEILAQKVAYG